MRTDILLAHHVLLLEVVHPCATAFALAWVEVCVIHSEELAFLVKHLVCGYFWVIYLDVLVLLEGHAIQAFCQTKDTNAE